MIGRRTVLAAIAACVIGAQPGQSQSYPTKTIRMIVPYTPGSPNDVLARLVTPTLSTQLGQTVVVDNRPGGGTSIGTRAVLAAEPDGYTLLLSNSAVHFIAPAVSKAVSYDPLKDFVPIALVASSLNVLVISPSIPANTLQEFVAYGKANPGKLNFGYGQGTLPQLIGALLRQETGVDFANVPYKGGAQAVTDLLGGRIHMNFGTTATLLPLIRDGRLRALAVTSTERSADLPDVPTMIEAGYPKVATSSFYGILGRGDLPADVVARVNTAVNESLKSPDLAAAMAKIGFQPKGGSPQDFATTIAGEMETWLPIVKATGFQMD